MTANAIQQVSAFQSVTHQVNCLGITGMHIESVYFPPPAPPTKEMTGAHPGVCMM